MWKIIAQSSNKKIKLKFFFTLITKDEKIKIIIQRHRPLFVAKKITFVNIYLVSNFLSWEPAGKWEYEKFYEKFWAHPMNHRASFSGFFESFLEFLKIFFDTSSSSRQQVARLYVKIDNLHIKYLKSNSDENLLQTRNKIIYSSVRLSWSCSTTDSQNSQIPANFCWGSQTLRSRVEGQNNSF